MLDSIGEAAIRTVQSTWPHASAEEGDGHPGKLDDTRDVRPVERILEDYPSQSDTGQKKGGYNFDENGVFFEKYDESGNVIFRAPPEQKPIDAHA